jgi:lipoprotein-anchoring transpeptidase ErfK/SrfK
MKRMNRRIAVVIAAALLLGAASVSAWEESDFPPRPLAAYSFIPSGPEPSTVIGESRSYTFAKGDTLYDVARHLGLGINEVTEAFPDLDVWLPPEGETLAFPTSWILPDSSYEGVVVNIPEMRLYYFPPHLKGGLHTAITYPVGLGRDEWRTPTGKFKVTEKTVNPKWVVPESIRAEHIRDRGDDRNMIPGGAPDNPLGHYRIRLSLPLYGSTGRTSPGESEWRSVTAASGSTRRTSSGCSPRSRSAHRGFSYINRLSLDGVAIRSMSKFMRTFTRGIRGPGITRSRK